MTNLFGCDMCGATTEFDENTALIKNGEKRKDLCPECEPLVESFIDEKRQTNDPVVIKDKKSWAIDTALELLMANGYKVTPIPQGRKKRN